jgi:sugar lactone lactonase YvrE
MTTRLVPQLFADVRSRVGEAPAWDAVAGRFTFVDILGREVQVVDGFGRVTSTFATPADVGAALPAFRGGWLLAMRDRFAVMDETGSIEDLLVVDSIERAVRFNDAKCDPAGRAFAGTMAYDETPGAGRVYRLDEGPEATTALRGTTISNGMGWDGGRFYFVDSPLRAVTTYEYDAASGNLGAELGRIPIDATVPGIPDGLCVDDDGCIWVAIFGGSAVHRYTPDGALDMVVDVPVSQPTSCAFGGPNGNLLVITTADHLLSPEARLAQPLAGAVFAIEVGASASGATPWRPLAPSAGGTSLGGTS